MRAGGTRQNNLPKWAELAVHAWYYLQNGQCICFIFYEIMFPDTFEIKIHCPILLDFSYLSVHAQGWCVGAYSKVIPLVLLSNFAQFALPCVRLNPVAQIPWAPSTTQNLKVTLIEWLLKLMLLALHQVFRPIEHLLKVDY